MKIFLIALIKLYQWTISPLIGHSCLFKPTCSCYMIIALQKYGLIKGFWIGLKRIFRCRPGNEGGEDPVP
mgnify:FL=1